MKGIKAILKERILVLDGAMGTLIKRYKLGEEDFRKEGFENHAVPLKGNYDILSLTRPDIIQDIHTAYLEAGADIIQTNTFSGTTIVQADYGLADAVYDINFQGARIARKITNDFTIKTPSKPRFVAGSMGPTNRIVSDSRGFTFNELVLSYKQQANALMDGGVDLLLIETVFDTLNAEAAIVAINAVFKDRAETVPIMISGTISDKPIEVFLSSLTHESILSVGFNCALGASMMLPYLHQLSNNSPFGISVHPNAGLPNKFGEYNITAELMGAQIKEFLDEGLVNIIGGCCGTTPEHILEIARIVGGFKPRKMGINHAYT
jgi:5-methyltetrahydrofolate--homocysteine methyltransferase